MPYNRCTVIYNGIDTNRFAPPETRHPGAPVVACVSRLVDLKRHDVLLKAARRLVDDGIAFRVRIVGDGPARAGIEAMIADLALGDVVELTGARADVDQILKDSDIFALPSSTEGLPMTIIEAMACQMPIVATRVGGIPELVDDGKNGILAPVGDVDALSAALRAVISDTEQRSAMGKMGRDLALQKFDIAVNTCAHEQLYVELLARKGIAVPGLLSA